VKLSRRDRHALIIGAVAIAAAAGYMGLVKPLWRARADLEGRRDIAVEYLARYRGIAAEGPALVAAADTAEARLAGLAPLTYAGEPQAALASLLEHVQRVAAASGVRVLQTNPVPGDTAAVGLQRIAVGLSCESDLAGLLDLLRALETVEKLIHVSGLGVERAGEAGPEGVQVLRFELTVEGFVDPRNEKVRDAQVSAP
jgi:type II secretory pathway component PulM